MEVTLSLKRVRQAFKFLLIIQIHSFLIDIRLIACLDFTLVLQSVQLLNEGQFSELQVNGGKMLVIDEYMIKHAVHHHWQVFHH